MGLQAILEQKRDHPELHARAVAMERGAHTSTVVEGLGRHWSWEKRTAEFEGLAEELGEDPVALAQSLQIHHGSLSKNANLQRALRVIRSSRGTEECEVCST